eukprot:6391858-Pyramimonas_sp.AAC.1
MVLEVKGNNGVVHSIRVLTEARDASRLQFELTPEAVDLFAMTPRADAVDVAAPVIEEPNVTW